MTCPHCFRVMETMGLEWTCNNCGVRRPLNQVDVDVDAERMAMELLKIRIREFRQKGG